MTLATDLIPSARSRTLAVAAAEPQLIPEPHPHLYPLPDPAPPSPSSSPAPAPANLPRACPRCYWTPLLTNFDEIKCVQCGYVEYLTRVELTAAESNADESIDIASETFRATTYAVRYAGAFEAQKSKVVYVTAYAEPNMKKRDAQLRVKCPFCESGAAMSPASLSGKRRRQNEARFRCEDGHRLSLVLHHGDKPWVWE